MITLELKKPVQDYTPYRSQQQHRSGVPWSFGAPAQQQQHRAPVHLGNVNDRRLYMDKIEFAKWVEGPEVKGKFHEGQLVTIASSIYVPDRLPSVIFLIDHIQEICFMAPIDADSRQPRCIGIKMDLSAPIMQYPPCKLRPLNEEEIKLVNLRNKKSGGAAGVIEDSSKAKASGEEASGETSAAGRKGFRTSILGGEVVVIDESTGEVVSERPDPNESYAG